MGKIMTGTSQGMSRRMKAAFVLLLTLATTVICLPQQADAAAVRVNSTTGSTGANAATSIAMTALPAAPVNGNLMIAVISTRGTSINNVGSITQTGVAWSRMASSTGTAGSTTEIWSGPVASGGGTAITINMNSSLFAAAVVMQYSGLVSGSAADKTAQSSGNSTAAVTGTTATTFQANELWIGGIGLTSSAFTLGTPLNTFTAVANAASTNATATSNARVYALERMVTATGAANSGGTVSATGQWSGAIVTFREDITNCSTCHGGLASFPDGTARNTPAGLFTGSHSGHVVTGGYDCAVCHVAPGATDHKHANGTITMASPLSGGSYVKGVSFPAVNPPTAFTTCNTTTCHGAVSPAWANNTTNYTCTKCHGKKVVQALYSTNNDWQAAPGYGGTGTDLGGASAATDAQVGAHDTHLRALNLISAKVTCNQCHIVPATAAAAGHSDSATPAEVVFSGTAVAGSGTAPTYVAGTCNNTYCHYGRSPYAPPATAQGAVGWTNTAYLTGVDTAAADCGKCHASPPLSTGTHSGGLTIASCNGCHDHVNTSGVFTNPSLHIDGIVQASGCDKCHGFPPTSGAHTKHITKIMAIKGLGTIPPGFVNNQVCGACHNDTSTLKHAGSVPNDGTSRNIYLPTATAYQQTYQFGASAPSYDKGGTTTCSNISCHLGSSTAWGTTAVTCNGCHGYPPVTTLADVDNKHAGTVPVNHIGTGAGSNTKALFLSAHGGCQICHGTQDSGSGTHSAHANYDPLTQHATGSLNMNGPAAAPSINSTQYDSVTRGCLNACHGSAAPFRMTASTSLPLTYGSYGPGGDCVSCHATAKGTRSAVSTEFGLAWGHKKAGRTAVTPSDCIVCHLEGDFTTQAVDSAYHLGQPGGNIDLRDPDGAGKTPITNNSGAAFTFTKYAISYAANSRTTTLGNTIPEVITVKFCMRCHDSNGASNPTARTRNATNTATTGTQYMPFEGISLGAAYTTVNGSAAANGLVNVASQFAAANSSRHPVGAPNSRAYPYSTRLAAPYNGLGTARDGNLTTGTAATPRTKANSVIMVCDDCHTTATTITTRMVTSHGNAGSLRGTYMEISPTLCTTCHIGVYADATNGRHNSGSAFAVGTTRAAAAMTRCNYCHFSNNTIPGGGGRPRNAQDIHGFNTMYNTAAGWTVGSGSGMRPVAFMRSYATSGGSWPTTHSPRPFTATLAGPGQFNLAAGQPNCGSGTNFAFNTGGSGLACSSNGHTNYSPGGSY